VGCDCHQSATWFQDLPRSLKSLTAHTIKNNIDVASFIFKTLRFVVDCLRGSQFPSKAQVVGRGRCDHMCATQACQLNRENANCAGAAMHQNAICSSNICAFE